MWEFLTDSSRWIDATTAWMLTYLLHSTLLLGLAFLISRQLPDRFLPIKETVWRSALIGGLLTATLQVGLGIDPLAGSWQIGLGGAADSAAIAHSQAGPADQVVPARLQASTGPVTSTQGTASQVPPTPQTPVQTLSAHSLSRWLLTGWLAIGICLLGLITVSYIRLLHRLDSRHPLTDGPLPALLRCLVARVAARPAHLAASAEIDVPLARGIRRREICLPQRMVSAMPEEQLEIVLAHELAHLERRDPLWLLAMRAFESLFFFQPMNRLARRALQEIAEFRCDDWAVSRTGRPVGMARCLTDVAGWSLDGRRPDLMPAMAVDRSQLGRRVSRLLARNYPAPPAPAPRWLGLAALLLLALVAIGAPGVTRASTSPSSGPEVIILGAEDSAEHGMDGQDSPATDGHPVPATEAPVTPSAPATTATAPSAPTAPTAPAVAPVAPVAPVADPASAPVAPVAPTTPVRSTTPAGEASVRDLDDLALQIEVRLANLEIDLEPLQHELNQLTIEVEGESFNSDEIDQLVREAVQMAINPEITLRLSEITAEISELAMPDPETLARIHEISAEIARAYAPNAEEIRQLVEASVRESSMSSEDRDRLREVAREARDRARDERDRSRQEGEVAREAREIARQERDQARQEARSAREAEDSAQSEARRTGDASAPTEGRDEGLEKPGDPATDEPMGTWDESESDEG